MANEERRAAGETAGNGVGAIGPYLHLAGVDDGRMALGVVLAVREDRPDPVVSTEAETSPGRVILRRGGWRVLRHEIALPLVADAGYVVDGTRYPVNADVAGDLAIAFVSCNGQEHGDRGRPLGERNRMWTRLAGRHAERPLNLLLQGGDQIYADEVLDAHPLARAWADGRADRHADDPAALAELADALADAFLARYLALLAQPEIVALGARVPTLAMWDDHDIVDGWGSLPPARLDSAVGRTIFSVARDFFLVFQAGVAPDEPPPIALDPAGATLSWRVRLPGVDLVAPDLRSERRPDRVMGEAGWRALETALAEADGRVLVLSSVPALGPRLSIVERLMLLTPWMEKYEDDLRDQWQSRAHRAEWRRFLESLAAVHARPATAVTVLSGEIHLATRGTLAVPPAALHQLVSSGIAHPAPPAAYPRALGLLARLGEQPLPGRPIRLHPLPGRRGIYAGERNYLLLDRRDGAWTAVWDLEESGPTPPLAI